MRINHFIERLGQLKKNLDERIFTYLTPSSKASLWMHRGKMVLVRRLYGIGYKDYFQCRCDQLSLYQISNLVPFSEQKKLWIQVNNSDLRHILTDKYKAYLHFRDYYQRDVILVSGRESEEEFKSFCHSHPRFIVKPLSRCCGRGIQLIDIYDGTFCIEDFIESNPDGFVVEELIKQNVVLSSLHPGSVNTLRINTVNYGDSVEVKWPCLRIGCGDSVVDNAGAGGIFGAIDVATGVITNVSDEFHHTFTEHPDTKISLIGFQVPKWQEACEMANSLARLFPYCPFVGWDLALTDNGWVMVEGNHRPLLIYQIATGKGIRKEFLEMKKRLLKK